MSREHQSFQPGPENIHAGRDNSNPYRDLVETSTQAALEILERTNIRRLDAVLSSRRRVNTIMDGVGVVSQPRLNGHDLLYRIPDVYFDLKSFTGMELDSTQIEYYYRTITELAAAFSDLALFKVRLLPTDIKRKIANNGGLEMAAGDCVKKTIWDRWTPRTEGPLEATSSLREAVKYFLNHLTFMARNHRGDSQSNHSIFLLDKERAHDYPLTRALEEWYMNVSNLRVWQVFYLIEGLEPRLRRALFDRFGYLYPEMLLKERLAKYKMSRKVLRGDFIRATREVLGIISTTHLTGREFPSRNIASIVKETEESPIYTMNQRVLHYDSPRLFLLRRRGDTTLVKKLNPTERQVLDLATQLEEGNFVNSNEAIAEKTGFSPGTIEGLIAIIAETAASKRPRFFYKSGYTISPSSDHYFLIETKDFLSSEQLAALHPSERRFLDMLTTPDEKGRYPGIRETKIELRVKGNVRKIIDALEEFYWVISLREKVKRALLRNREGFSGEEIEIMEYILESIREGRPLRSKTCRGIGWNAIYRELGKHRNRGCVPSRKLKALGGQHS